MFQKLINPIIKQVTVLHTRRYSATVVSASPLDQFRDSVTREKRFSELVGRSWSATELRRKSFDDLHKLWKDIDKTSFDLKSQNRYVLYKEKNMILTEANIHRRGQMYLPQPERLQKVKKSMGAIKTVLGERKRDAISRTALRQSRMEEEVKGSGSENIEK